MLWKHSAATLTPVVRAQTKWQHELKTGLRQNGYSQSRHDLGMATMIHQDLYTR